MGYKVLIAHAEGEEQLAEKLAISLREAGYEVFHHGTVKVGESIIGESSKILAQGGPVILCGTVKAVGTAWVHKLVNAAQRYAGVRVFVIQMEKDAYIEAFSFQTKIAFYWEDPDKAISNLLEALNQYYPTNQENFIKERYEAEQRYYDLLLKTCDIVSLATLPNEDRSLSRNSFELRRLYVPLRILIENKECKDINDARWTVIDERFTGNLTKRGIENDAKHKHLRMPIGECLKETRRLIVLGEPGAGKTTLIRWIATAYLLKLKNDSTWKDLPDIESLPDEDLFPIIVRCRDLEPKCFNGRLEDILHCVLRRAELSEIEIIWIQKIFLEKLRSGTALLLIDGLDEITDNLSRARFCEQLDRIQQAYPAPIIITSRIVSYRETSYRLGQEFEHAILADLNPKEKDEFATRWCYLKEPPEIRDQVTKELINSIHSSDRIERMAGNPMLLTTMALVKRKVGKLPIRRHYLFSEAVQVLLNWRSEFELPLESDEAIPQLEYIAYEMCNRGVQRLRRDEILNTIAKMRIDYPNIHQIQNHTPEEFLHLLEARTGLIAESGYVDYLGLTVPVYEFSHQTFQEYLAARALVDGRFPGRDPNKSLADNVAPLAGLTMEMVLIDGGMQEIIEADSWRETLRLCTTFCPDDDVDSVLEAILIPLEGETKKTRRARSILATFCIADEPNASEKKIEKIFKVFASEVIGIDGNERIKTGVNSAAIEIARTRWASKLQFILAEEFCRRAPTNRHGPGVLCGLIGAATHPKDSVVFNEWLETNIKRFQSEPEIEAIVFALTIMELAFQGKVYEDPRVGLAETLISRLNCSNPMACASAWALGWLNDKSILKDKIWIPKEEHIEYFLAIISNSSCDQEVVRFLAWIFGREKVAKAVPFLLSWANNQNPVLRRDLVISLGNIGGEKAVDALISYLNDPDVNVRRSAINILSQNLEDNDSYLRCGTAEALGLAFEIIPDKTQGWQALLRLAKDSDPVVKRAAAEAIRSIFDYISSNKTAWEDIHELANDTDYHVRRCMAETFGSTFAYAPNKTTTWGNLIKLTQDDNCAVRFSASFALGSAFQYVIDKDKASEDLFKIINSQDRCTRWGATGALGLAFCSIPNKIYAWKNLIKLTRDEDSRVRRITAVALETAFPCIPHEPEVWKDIHILAQDPDRHIRHFASEAIESAFNQVSDKEILWEDLYKLSKDPSHQIRRHAAKSLGLVYSEISDKEQAWQDLHRLAHDENNYVRSMATQSLGLVYSEIPDREQALQDLHQLSHDEDSYVRSMAAQAFGLVYSEISDKEQAWQDLHRLVQDEDSYVRCMAAQAFGLVYSEISDKEQAWQDLHRLVQDEDSYVRCITYYALGRISIFRATEATEEYDFKTYLEEAIEFFVRSSQNATSESPAAFCLPFYRSLHGLLFTGVSTEVEINRNLKDARNAIMGSESKEMLLEAVENLSQALAEAKKFTKEDESLKRRDIKAYMRYCSHAAELLEDVRERAPLASTLIKRGLPIIDKKLKTILQEIEKASRDLYGDLKGTELEEFGKSTYERTRGLAKVDSPIVAERYFEEIVPLLKAHCDRLPKESQTYLITLIKSMESASLLERFDLLKSVLVTILIQSEHNDSRLKNYDEIMNTLRSIEYNTAFRNLHSEKAKYSLIQLQESINKLSNILSNSTESQESLFSILDKRDNINIEILDNTRKGLIKTIEEFADKLPTNEDTREIIKEIRALKQSNLKDPVTLLSDISACAGVAVNLINLIDTLSMV